MIGYQFPSLSRHPEWEGISDEELLKDRSDPQIAEFLLERYKMLVKVKTRSYFCSGVDEADLIQEGMIGLLNAIRAYDAEKNASFQTFANVCVTHAMQTSVKAARRRKNQMLNDYVPLCSMTDDQEEEWLASDAPTPEELVIANDSAKALKREIVKALSPYENEILKLYLHGDDYRTIAAKLDKKPKSIDNALQRIRQKVNQIVEASV